MPRTRIYKHADMTGERNTHEKPGHGEISQSENEDPSCACVERCPMQSRVASLCAVSLAKTEFAGHTSRQNERRRTSAHCTHCLLPYDILLYPKTPVVAHHTHRWPALVWAISRACIISRQRLVSRTTSIDRTGGLRHSPPAVQDYMVQPSCTVGPTRLSPASFEYA